MSYETNPILNRLKISKGWKTSSFVANSLNYSRDLKLWFKVYLFLKVYLLLHGIRLLKCEHRLSASHTKVLYLFVIKQTLRGRNKKSKRKTKSFLQHVQSSLTKARNKKARFLLYLDLPKLKKNTSVFGNQNHKKMLSQIWMAKPRPYSWTNSAHLLYRSRLQYKWQQQLLWKKKGPLFQRVTKKRISSFKRGTETQKNFWQKKQRNLFRCLTKIQKEIFFFKSTYTFFLHQAAQMKNISLQKLTSFLFNQLQKKKLLWQHIRQVSHFVQEKQFFLQTRPLLLSKKTALLWAQKKTQKQHQLLGWHFRETLRHFQRRVFLSPTYMQKIYVWHRQHLLTNNPQFLTTLKYANMFPRNVVSKTFGLHNYRPFLRAKKIANLVALRFLVQTKFFRKPRRIILPHFFLWKRFTQKKNKSALISTFQTRSKTAYRLSAKANYKNFLHFSTSTKLKYLLQDLIAKYFGIESRVKIAWPLSQFKNLRFYRLLFPTHKSHNAKKKTAFCQIWKKKRVWRKKYRFLQQNTKHLRFQTPSSITPQIAANAFFNFQQQKQTKKNTYLMKKKRILRAKSEKRLSSFSRTPLVSDLITTLTWFAKYLDPQPVVDHIAKIIGNTKKHLRVLQQIELILRTFNLQRGLGYRIALIGRINGANKSRTVYLRKLNRNRSRQSFSQDVNFALAHAKATIGTFAIKLWIYS